MHLRLASHVMAALIACPGAGCTRWAYDHLGSEEGTADTADAGADSTATALTTAIADPPADTSGSGVETNSDDSGETMFVSGSSGSEDTGTSSDTPCEAGQVALTEDGIHCLAMEDVRFVFVTSDDTNGDFSHPADVICQNLADKSSYLHGRFKAWVSSLTESPSNDPNFGKDFHGKYVKLDLKDDPEWGERRVTLVATGWAGLTSGALVTAIDVTERGQVVTGEKEFAWTGTTPSGTVSMYPSKVTIPPLLCDKFESWNRVDSECLDVLEGISGWFGSVGKIGATDTTWTELWPSGNDELSCGADVVQKYLCDSRHRIYCIQS